MCPDGGYFCGQQNLHVRAGVASERPWQDCHRIPHPGARKQGSFPPTPILGCHCQGHSWEVGPLQATELHGKPGELGEPSSGDLWDGLKE